ncbi:nuclear transport factor 2 family protein [Streptomyces sp. NPDC004610]|uniref:nuclear transport factor 2 family protein n=1 Tax=unclassified Streptomyces TaxID=2593676 RepID=UPI0033AEE357
MHVSRPRTRVAALALAVTAALVGGAVPAASAAPAPAHASTAKSTPSSYDTEYNKAVALRVLTGVIPNGDYGLIDQYIRDDYIQHNPQIADGAAAFKGFAAWMRSQYPDFAYNVKRIVAEGDLVIVHGNPVQVPGTRGVALFDIYRFQDGKIAEHWDVIQPVPATTVSGNDMFSTLSSPQPGSPVSKRETARNEKLVKKYVNRLYNGRDLSAIDAYVAPGVREHAPELGDGAAAVKQGVGTYLAENPELTYDTKRVIAEGDLVAVHSHVTAVPGTRGQAVIDMYRVRGGKIVEHWKSVQAVPEGSANGNTMF